MNKEEFIKSNENLKSYRYPYDDIFYEESSTNGYVDGRAKSSTNRINTRKFGIPTQKQIVKRRSIYTMFCNTFEQVANPNNRELNSATGHELNLTLKGSKKAIPN